MSSEYILKKMITFHCKRGHSRCDRCKELYDEGPKYCILEIPSDTGMMSRPITLIMRAGTESYVEYDFYQCYKTKQEMVKASANLNIVFTDFD